MKLVRNQYPFDVTMRRGLRGGAHNYPLPADGPVAPSTPARTPEAASRKFVQGIPALYSRSSRKETGPTAVAGEGGNGNGDVAPLDTAERLLRAAQQREAAAQPKVRFESEVRLPPAAAPAPHAADERLQQQRQESALQARLRAMVCVCRCVSFASSAVLDVACACTCPRRDLKSTPLAPIFCHGARTEW
jgi:hypothetical protein